MVNRGSRERERERGRRRERGREGSVDAMQDVCHALRSLRIQSVNETDTIEQRPLQMEGSHALLCTHSLDPNDSTRRVFGEHRQCRERLEENPPWFQQIRA